MHRLANVLQAGIAHESARQQPRLAQNLKSIANSEDDSAAISKLLHRLHHGRELSDGAGAEVVAISKSAGHDHCVAVFQIMRLMPQKSDWLLQYLLNSPVGVVIAIRARENDYAKFHRFLSGDSLNFNMQKIV